MLGTHFSIVLLVAAAPTTACEAANTEGELTREQCAELVRKVRQLNTADTGGLKVAMQASHGGSVEGCLRKGTERAYRCVLQSDTLGALSNCDSLYR
jgi:hypothetical protein